MSRRIAPVVVVALALAVAAPVSANTTTVVGNDAIDRSLVDTWYSFLAIDSTNSVTQAGVVEEISYFAKSGPDQSGLALAIVRPQDSEATVGDDFKVLWIGPTVTPTLDAVNVADVPSVAVQPGDDLAVWSEGRGVVPFDYDGTLDPTQFPSFTWLGSSKPSTGDVVNVDETSTSFGQPSRRYSMNATVLSCTYAIQQPINATAPYSVFKQGRGVVPVKVTSSCGTAGGAPVVTLRKVGIADEAPNETISSVSAADTGTTMRWDPVAQQYVYNLSAKAIATGEYLLTLTAPAGSTSTTFQLAK